MSATFADLFPVPSKPTLISELHDAWTAGEVDTAELPQYLGALWTQFGSSLEAPQLLAMLRAAGPVVVADDGPLPRRLTVFQGRPEGEPLGIGWTTKAEAAAGYAMFSFARRLGVASPVVYRGTTLSRNVLLRDGSEMVIDPSDVRGVHPISSDHPAWEATEGSRPLGELLAEVGPILRSNFRLFYRLRAPYRPTMEAYVQLSLLIEQEQSRMRDLLEAARAAIAIESAS